jgi:germination protein M
VRRLVAFTLALAASVTVAACGGGAQQAGPVPAPELPPASTGPGGTDTGAGQTDTGPSTSPTFTYEVWFLRGEQLQAVSRTSEKTAAVATTALRSLLAGPTSGEAAAGLSTSIPGDTKLLGITVGDGIATVDLSSEYESGGGSLSMTARLAQVVFTLTQFPTVERVRFELDGQPVHVFSGEGIVLDHPVGREDYDLLLPAIVVERPEPHATVSSPVRVSGNADVFEANVTVRILDGNGREIARDFTTATCGTGCRGTYSLAVPFTVSHEQQGTIVVQDDDAAGTGKPPHSVEIPVTLAP